MAEETKTKKAKAPEPLSAADLELSQPLAVGEPVEVKSNPELPSIAQIEANTDTVPGPAKVKVSDGDGEEMTLQLGDAALIAQRAASAVPHPSFAQPGHAGGYSLTGPTEEDAKKDDEDYKSRYS